jgi:metal-sulfur cluster biosynthetic enzyme
MPSNSILMSEDSVLEALREVIDPELGENLVDLGLIYDIRLLGVRVEVDLTLTTPGCPLHASLHAAAERAIRLMVPGVEEVQVNLVFEPRWSPERMSAAAKHRLGFK